MPRLLTLPLFVSAALAALGANASAAEQRYPAKPVHIVVPGPSTGAVDKATRVVAGRLPEYLGQPVVVENRPSGSSITGSEAVAKAPPDGYTLLAGNDGSLVMNTLAFKSLPYDPLRDFTPLSLMATQPLIVVVNAGTGIYSVAELLKSARANPGRLNKASSGVATAMALELFNAMASTDIVAVPYKSPAEALNSVISGETQVSFTALANAPAALKSDKVRVIAITSAQRSPLFPEWPTVAETVSGYEATGWVGLFGPAKLPPEISARVTTEVRRILAKPDVRSSLRGAALEPAGTDGEELMRVLRGDIEKWSRVARERNLIKPGD